MRMWLAAAAMAVISAMGVAQTVSAWRAHVPEKDRSKISHIASSAENVAAGEVLFRENCATCHGRDAAGRGRKPSLRSDAVRANTDGELMWLLSNGSLAHGMPSWSKLPEAERWQIIAYLRTLPGAGAPRNP